MKQRFLCAFLIAFSFIARAELTKPHPVKYFPLNKQHSLNTDWYVSEWTMIKDWKQVAANGKNGFITTQSIPLANASLRDAVVFAFAKMQSSDPSYKIFQKPVTLPFVFWAKEAESDAYYWFDVSADGKINIGWQTDGTYLNDGNVQMAFRYVVLTKDFLMKKQLDAATLKHYSYPQLAAMLGMKE